MNIYEEPGIKAGSPGSMHLDKRKHYFYKEQQLQQFFVSHGSTCPHAYKTIRNQITPEKDKKVGRDEGRHLNQTFARSLVFTTSVRRHYELKWSRSLQLPEYSLEELYTGIIYLYDKEPIGKLVAEDKALFMRLAKHSKTHKYNNPNEYLGEYYVSDINDLPDPRYILVGNSGIKLKHKDKIDIFNVFKKYKDIYSDTEIIYFPGLFLGKGKEDGATGNLTGWKPGIQVINKVLNVHKKLCKPTHII